MKNLKDALAQKGFRPTKMENERKSAKGRERSNTEKHQMARNFCEHCNTTQPDVERYKHRNPTTDAHWICVRCADELMINDDCRATNQSDFAKRGMFSRRFGATKDFSKDNPEKKFRNNDRRDREGNRDNRGHKKGPRKGGPHKNKPRRD